METLIMCILGDIIGHKNNDYRTENFKRITKNTYGESFIKEGLFMVSQHYIEYIANGGAYNYIDYIDYDYSYLTELLYVTLKYYNNKKSLTIFLGHWLVSRAKYSMPKKQICMPRPVNMDIQMNTFHAAV